MADGGRCGDIEPGKMIPFKKYISIFLMFMYATPGKGTVQELVPPSYLCRAFPSSGINRTRFRQGVGWLSMKQQRAMQSGSMATGGLRTGKRTSRSIWEIMDASKQADCISNSDNKRSRRISLGRRTFPSSVLIISITPQFAQLTTNHLSWNVLSGN